MNLHGTAPVGATLKEARSEPNRVPSLDCSFDALRCPRLEAAGSITNHAARVSGAGRSGATPIQSIVDWIGSGESGEGPNGLALDPVSGARSASTP
jgi:hypothetical protein